VGKDGENIGYGDGDLSIDVMYLHVGNLKTRFFQMYKKLKSLTYTDMSFILVNYSHTIRSIMLHAIQK